jgi:hypothetical protein
MLPFSTARNTVMLTATNKVPRQFMMVIKAPEIKPVFSSDPLLAKAMGAAMPLAIPQTQPNMINETIRKVCDVCAEKKQKQLRLIIVNNNCV